MKVSVWWVFPIVGLIALLVMLAFGKVSEGVLLGLLLLLVLGAIYPPFGVGFGGIILLTLFYKQSGKFFDWANSLTKLDNQPGPFTPLGPTLPGYKYNSATGTYGVLGKSI